ncbi:hypothetical protein HELRODRAFT_174157 [Helobdella robusta]|uniref:Uncharacterized protein n=1 Tax=Helobdella robusta TaxID=6412 RepID=T1F7P5_HELRO|nr:hypothetical protein HELRODRAFT_174157 [Helobdella robusta]ESO02751.1 hypothetical protein HELRODRAFT_174157 [Helobdella robusta]
MVNSIKSRGKVKSKKKKNSLSKLEGSRSREQVVDDIELIILVSSKRFIGVNTEKDSARCRKEYKKSREIQRVSIIHLKIKFCKGRKGLKMHQRSCAIHKRLKLSVEIENGNETANSASKLDSTPPEDKQQSHSKNATQQFPSTNATHQPSSNSTLQQLLPNSVMQQFSPTNATEQISSTNAMQHHSSNNAAQQVPLTNDMQQPSPSNNMQEFSPTNALLQSQSTKVIQQLPSTNAIQRFSPTNAMQQPSLANTMQQFSSTNASQESPPTKPLKTDNWAPSSDKTAMPLAGVILPKSHAQWLEANTYFQLQRHTLPNFDNLNNFTVAFQTMIYNYFAKNYGTIKHKVESDVNNNHQIRLLKKELKHLKQLGHDNHHFDAKIGLVSKLLRSKLALKQSANAKKTRYKIPAETSILVVLQKIIHTS